nr:class I SAM-dependent methyltransferase [Clostridium saccharoperbutylacetonicum]
MKHHNEFADFIKKFQPKNVLEIGGATGILAKVYMDKNNIKWSIIEPNPIPVEGCKAEFIKDFFNEKYILLDEYDSIVHSHVLEHMYEPDIFIKNLSDCLGEGKKMFFSIPNMMEMLKRKYTNTLNFEHTFFATEQYIEYLLAKFRFEILNKEYFMDDGSIFYAVEKRGNVDIKELDKNLYSVNKGIFIDYINYHRNMITKFNEKMKESNMKVYLFGAHIFTQYLIEFGLDTSKIISILDNDVHKQGKRLSGTELYVESPKILKDEEAAIVILKVGIYNSEIKKDILENINSNIEFLE